MYLFEGIRPSGIFSICLFETNFSLKSVQPFLSYKYDFIVSCISIFSNQYAAQYNNCTFYTCQLNLIKISTAVRVINMTKLLFIPICCLQYIKRTFSVHNPIQKYEYTVWHGTRVGTCMCLRLLVAAARCTVEAALRGTASRPLSFAATSS